jgi:hypothetical protein
MQSRVCRTGFFHPGQATLVTPFFYGPGACAAVARWPPPTAGLCCPHSPRPRSSHPGSRPRSSHGFYGPGTGATDVLHLRYIEQTECFMFLLKCPIDGHSSALTGCRKRSKRRCNTSLAITTLGAIMSVCAKCSCSREWWSCRGGTVVGGSRCRPEQSQQRLLPGCRRRFLAAPKLAKVARLNPTLTQGEKTDGIAQ